MNFQRLYIDSRDRVSGTPSNFTYQPPMDIVVPEESIAVLDTVLLPVSWYSVTKGKNDEVYATEHFGGNQFARRIVTIPQGFYDVQSLAKALQDALNAGRFVEGVYGCTYNPLTGKLEIVNSWTGENESLDIQPEVNFTTGTISPTLWGRTLDTLAGAFRAIGMVNGQTAQAGNYGTMPNSLVLNNSPNLNPHSQVFIKGSLGIPGLVQGPRGAQDVLRRCVITAPAQSLSYDQAASHYDNIRIAPGTISALNFQLVGYDGAEIDLNGLDWSFSVVIFPQD